MIIRSNLYIVFYSMIFSLQSTRILLAMSFKAEKKAGGKTGGGEKGIGGTDVTCSSFMLLAAGWWGIGGGELYL